MTKAVADDIVDCCKTVVGLEDRFIDLAFEAGPVQGMTPEDIKTYIRFIADWRLRQLELPDVYGVRENPLPWLQSLLSASSTPTSSRPAPRNIPRPRPPASGTATTGVWGEFDRMMARRGMRGCIGARAYVRDEALGGDRPIESDDANRLDRATVGRKSDPRFGD